ncbi:MAG: hypothetical protein R6U67_19095 [Sodalinema sp.]
MGKLNIQIVPGEETPIMRLLSFEFNLRELTAQMHAVSFTIAIIQ